MKILRIILLIAGFTLICVNENQAQMLLKIKRSQFKIIDIGFKDAWKAVNEGNKMVIDGLGTYRVARKNYLKAYRYNPNNPELNYMIGICYLYTDDKFEALKYLKKAFAAKPDVSPDVRLMIGKAYHHMFEFDNAILEYSEYLRTVPPKRIASIKPFVDDLITECRNGKDLVANPYRIVVLNPGKNINSEFDDYNPVISSDDSIMYYTSRRMLDEKSPRNPYDNKYYEDVYVSENKNGEWKSAQRFNSKVNKKKNRENNAAVGISPDKKELYLYVGKSNSGDIYKTTFYKGKWTSLKAMSGKINTKNRETSVCISSDGKKMFFISNNPKTSYGGSDIYMTSLNEKGKWQKPVNIGSVVNSRKDEVAISLSKNDSVMYFSSKGHKTMGGFDVFKSVLKGGGLWSVPENMGYPVNTPDDDVFYKETEPGKIAYYSTIRESGIGEKDIYKIIFLGAEKEMLQTDENVPILGLKQPYESIFFTIPGKMEVDTSITMLGKITDSENGKGIMSKLELIDPDLSKAVATAISDTGGNYKVKVPLPKLYGVEIVAKGYLLLLDAVDLKGQSFENDVYRDFKLDRVEVGAKVILKNIFFEFGKATLKSESYVELNNVVKLLQNNESVRLEISGHTDNIGGLKTNMKLSEDRAKAVVDYLIKQGISASRLEYKGYAYTQPIAPNTTEAGRAKNRRVEFKVLSK